MVVGAFVVEVVVGCVVDEVAGVCVEFSELSPKTTA